MASRAKSKNEKGSIKTPDNVRRLAPLADTTDPVLEYLEAIVPSRGLKDLVLNPDLNLILKDVLTEIKHGEELRRHGLPLREKLLLCGPPGCGKTLCAEVLAKELRLPLYIVQLDSLISSYLGETASNMRKVFDFARRVPCVIFFDEFDAIGRTRSDHQEHSELRRVLNSLLTIIERHHSRGMVIAATNLQGSLDDALWRRFDEILEFNLPNDSETLDLMKLKFKNFKIRFSLEKRIGEMEGLSFADIERVCFEAIKRCLIEKRKSVTLKHFTAALDNELRRRSYKTSS